MSKIRLVVWMMTVLVAAYHLYVDDIQTMIITLMLGVATDCLLHFYSLRRLGSSEKTEVLRFAEFIELDGLDVNRFSERQKAVYLRFFEQAINKGYAVTVESEVLLDYESTEIIADDDRKRVLGYPAILHVKMMGQKNGVKIDRGRQKNM